MNRAERALRSLLGVELTAPQRDQMDVANRFVEDARQARSSEDLVRACAVAEKARIMAEELRSTVTP
jgi:hypothetical protein